MWVTLHIHLRIPFGALSKSKFEGYMEPVHSFEIGVYVIDSLTTPIGLEDQFINSI